MKHRRSFEEILAMIGWIIAVMFFLSVLASCTTERKAVNYFNKHPELSAKFCGDAYPVKSEYKPGETIIKRDTVIVSSDSVLCPPAGEKGANSESKPVYVKCPPNKTITQTIFRTDTLIKENTAKLESLRYDLAKVQADNAGLKKDKKALVWTVVILGLFGFLELIYILR